MRTRRCCAPPPGRMARFEVRTGFRRQPSRRVDDDFLDPLVFRPDSLLQLQVEALVDRPVPEIQFGWSRIYAVLDRQPPFGGDIELDESDDFTLADSYTLAGEGHVRIAAGRDYRDPRVHTRSVGYRAAARGATALHSFGAAGAAFETDATAEGSVCECASSVRCASGEKFPLRTPSTDRAVAGSRPTLPWIPDGAILFRIQPRSSRAYTTTPTRTRADGHSD